MFKKMFLLCVCCAFNVSFAIIETFIFDSGNICFSQISLMLFYVCLEEKKLNYKNCFNIFFCFLLESILVFQSKVSYAKVNFNFFFHYLTF